MSQTEETPKQNELIDERLSFLERRFTALEQQLYRISSAYNYGSVVDETDPEAYDEGLDSDFPPGSPLAETSYHTSNRSDDPDDSALEESDSDVTVVPASSGPVIGYDPEDDEEQESDGLSKMGILDHIEQLRWVVFKCVIVLILGTVGGLSFTAFLMGLVMHPVKPLIEAGRVEVFYHTPIAGFMVMLKLGLLAGVIFGLPAILYFIWQFVSPGLKHTEKKYGLFSLIVGFGSFLCGASFGYWFLKLGIPALLSFGFESIKQFWPISEYIGFCVKLILAFGIVFEMPVLFGLLSRLGLVSSEGLKSGRRYAFVIILVVGALLTPPDVISQVGLALPMYLLYELSIFVAKWQERKASATV